MAILFMLISLVSILHTFPPEITGQGTQSFVANVPVFRFCFSVKTAVLYSPVECNTGGLIYMRLENTPYCWECAAHGQRRESVGS